MTRRALRKSSRGAAATGATAAGAASVGAVALGAMALGAIAVGALAVGRLTVGRARLRRVEIGELTVGRVRIGDGDVAGRLIAIARVNALPGKGDELEQLVQDRTDSLRPGDLPYRAHRSRVDPDLFLFSEAHASEAPLERGAAPPGFEDLLRQAAEEGLIAAFTDDQVELYRTV